MLTFSEKQGSSPKHEALSLAGSKTSGLARRDHPSLRLLRTDNPVSRRTVETHAEEPGINLSSAASPRFAYDFGEIPLYPPATATRTTLTLGQSGDEYEQEADRVSDQVMRMAERQPQCRACGRTSREYQNQEHPRLQIKRSDSADPEQTSAPSIIGDVLREPGQPLDAATRAYFEPRFAHDFSHVRVHTSSGAADSVRAVRALAYTVGRDVVFGAGQYLPHTVAGRQLIAHELTHVVQQSGAGRTVRRAVVYPAPTVTTENPIHRVLRAESALALTTPTVNGVALTSMDAAIRLLKDAFQPTVVESKNVSGTPAKGSGSGSGAGSAGTAGGGSGSGSGSAGKVEERSGSGSASPGKTGAGSGSGSGSAGSAGSSTECRFKDFDVKISATMILPTAPSHGQWGPIYVAGSDLRGSPPAICQHKTRIEVVMKGKPDTDTFYQKIKANEQEHVNDFKSASDQYLVPFYREILALKGTAPDANACKANLQAELEHLPDDKIRSFLTRLIADIQRHDVPGGHPTQEQTHLDPHCDRMEITGEPKPAPRTGRIP